MPVDPHPYGWDSDLVPHRADMTRIRTDLLNNKNISITAVGLFACVLSGAFEVADAYKWWKNTSSNQIKTAVNELIAAGYVSDKGGKLIFHNEPKTK